VVEPIAVGGDIVKERISVLGLGAEAESGVERQRCPTGEDSPVGHA
jgi:hypothetical protein